MATDTVDLKIGVEEPQAWARRLTITVPAGRVDEERRSVTRRIRTQVRLPGFRKGKVPESVVSRKFEAAIQNETVERIVDEAYKQAIQEQGLQPITQGQVEDVDYAPGADLTFHVVFEVQPKIELDRVGGFVVERPSSEVGEEEVERVLERLRSENAEWKTAEEGKPTTGDRVAVEITPLSAEAEPGGEAPKPRKYEVVLGEGQAIPDVESAIQTLDVGGSGEFLITIPNESEDEAGEEQRVRIELLSLERPDLPEMDDAFAASVGDFESMDVLRARVREDLQRESDSEAEAQVRRALVDQIIEANPFDVPDSMVRAYIEDVFPSKQMPQERLAELHQAARPTAERAIRRSLVVDAVAEKEGLRPSAEEVDARVEQIAEQSGRPVNEVWTQLQRSGRMQRLEGEVLEEKVFAFLKAQSEITGAAPATGEAPAKSKSRSKKSKA